MGWRAFVCLTAVLTTAYSCVHTPAPPSIGDFTDRGAGTL